MKLNLQKENGQKGITLIALVITIIVLLILAGVAINMAINSDGLFGKANEATESWNTSVEQEQTAIQELLNELGVAGVGGGPTEPEGPTLPDGWDANKIATTVTQTSTVAGQEATRTVPIPKGFTVSQIGGDIPENTIAGGLVIYQIPEGATVDWENSKITLAGESTEKVLQEEANQYVWIPVDDINQMVMCKGNNKDADADGNKICNIELVDGVLQCTNSAHTTNATNLCGRLYGTSVTSTTVDGKIIYTTSMNFSDRTKIWTDNSGYREPDIVSSYDKDDTESTTRMATAGITSGKVADFQTQLTTDFTAMVTSVAKYGGFYVSRYEAGVNGASLKNQVVITAGSSTGTSSVYTGVDNWYGLYNAVRKEITVGTSTMQSHMIYGSQYDQIINFIGSEAQTGHPGNVVTSQSKTGTKETDKLNNIYDLEGNNIEWTAQVCNTNIRVYRGGYYNPANGGSFHPASHRNDRIPSLTGDYYSTRPALYL